MSQNDRLASQVLASATDFAIISQDKDGLITSWNPGAKHLLGWDAEELIGKSADVSFTPEDREAGVPEEEASRARAEGRALLRCDRRWRRRTGSG